MDIYSPSVLARVVGQLPPPEPFFLNRFFKEIQLEEAQEIHFDIEHSRPRLAPFVSPIVAGQVVRSRGYTTQVFTPAYVKDKRLFDSTRAFKRAIGERIGGELGAEARVRVNLARALEDQVTMLSRREEAMAGAALRTGNVVVEGDSYPRVEVDFGRDPTLTGRLLGNDRWGEANATPLADVEQWSLDISKLGGGIVSDVVMGMSAWRAFAESPEVQDLIGRFRGDDQLNPSVAGEGCRYMGSIGDFSCWLYLGGYELPETGELTPFVHPSEVVLVSDQLQGVRAYAAIHDEEAGFGAMPYFPKSWADDDPSVRYLLMQSAPLPVPYRVNGSACWTVL